MHLGRVLAAILLSGFVSMMTDWFFGGILFHEKYSVYPEVWRPSVTAGEGKAVAGSVLLGFFSCGIFVLACLLLHIQGYAEAFRFAAAIWLIGPVPVLITNALFIKLHPLPILSNSVGWLVKLLLAAAAVGWLVS